jgi:hypothetical protein
METISKIEEFCDPKNLDNYLVVEEDDTLCGLRLYEFIGNKTARAMTVKLIKKDIIDGLVKVNNTVIKNPQLIINLNDTIFYKEFIYKCAKKILINDFNQLLINHFFYLNNRREIKDIFRDNLGVEETQIVVASLLRLKIGLGEKFQGHSIHYKINKFFDDNLSEIYKKNNINDKSNPDDKIERLNNIKIKLEQYLKDIIKNFDNIYKLDTTNQEIRKLFRSLECAYLIKPFFPKELVSNSILDTLFKPIKEIQNSTDKAHKHELYNKVVKIYNEYKENVLKSKLYYSKIFLEPLITNLKKILTYEVFGDNSGKANIQIEEIPKKYPLFKVGEHDILLKLKNDGQGYALNLIMSVHSSDVEIKKKIFSFENLQPGELTLDVPIRIVIPKEIIKFNIVIQWTDYDGSTHKKNIDQYFKCQSTIIDWEKLQNRKPYALRAIEDKDKLLGRDQLVNEIIENINSNTLDSFILFGQKRVGKTSIVKTINKMFYKINEVIIIYLDCTNIRQLSVEDTISELGKQIIKEIRKEILIKYKNNSDIVNLIKSSSSIDFRGSITPIKDLFDTLEIYLPTIKIMIIIDEFDELQYEIYKPGNISDTFFRNFRGLNNHYSNLGFILVGSENMPKIYNWHGEQLNNWKNRTVDTFDKETQYPAFRKLIESPVYPDIKYLDDAIAEIYEQSSGNPYFTNMICSWVFDMCVERRDSEVTKHDIVKSINLKLKNEAKTSFQHFWKDGILEPSDKKELISDLRRRTLLAMSRAFITLREGSTINPINETDVEKYFNVKNLPIGINECKKQLNDFKDRDIIILSDLGMRIKPKIFEKWLTEYGMNEIVEGVADLEELQKEQKIEDSLYLKDIEIGHISDRYRYQGRSYNIKEIREWIEQFGLNSNQRLIYKILRNGKYYSEEDIKSICRSGNEQVFKGITWEIGPHSKKLRRENALVTILKYGYEDNEVFAKLYAELSSIPRSNILKLNKYDPSKIDNIKILIIFHPLLFNSKVVFDEILNFFTIYGEIISTKIERVVFISIISLNNQCNVLQNYFVEHNINIKLFSFEDVEEKDVSCFSERSDFFDSNNEKSKACEIISKHSKFNNLNKYLALFTEPICPQICIPIFWNKEINNEPIFPNINKIYIENDILPNYKQMTKQLGDDLEKNMNKITINILKELSNNWWIEFIPDKIRIKCMERWDYDKRIENEWNYLDFIDYSEIALKNECLKKYFYYDESKTDYRNISNTKGTAWLSKLNELRKIYSHASREKEINKDDYEMMKKMSAWFLSNMKG